MEITAELKQQLHYLAAGDDKIEFDIYIEKTPKNFDSTISQIKYGSGKHTLKRTPGYFKKRNKLIGR